MDETPRGRRRRRTLAGEGDEHSDGEIDELLEELGIPTSDSKKQDKRRREAAATPPCSAPAEVIELITPPREALSPQFRVGRQSPSAVDVGSDVRTPERRGCGGGDSGRRASIVDLTSTPSPVAPASTTGATGARDSSRMLSPAESLHSELREVRRSVTYEDSGDSVTIVNLDSDGHSDSDAEYGEIFSTGLRRVAREPLPLASPARSPPRSLDFSLPRFDPIACTASVVDARTSPLKKRKRPHAATSPAGPTSTDLLGSPAPSIFRQPAPSPGRIRATKQPAAPMVPGGSTSASISVRLERSLDESEAGNAVRQALRTHVYNGKPLSVEFLPSFDCKYPRVILLDRCAGALTSQSSAGSSSTSPSTASCACAIYFDAHAFLKLLLEETYAGLTMRVEFLTRFIGEKWVSNSATREEGDGAQIFVIVERMDHALVEYKKNARKNKQTASGSSQTTQPDLLLAGSDLPEISFEDLNEVAFQLFMDLGVHTKFTCDSEASASYVAMIAREMVVCATRKSNEEEFLESVPRLHSFRVGASGVTANNFSNAWLRMLQTIPGVSEDKAQSLMDHFPTFESLMRAYRDPMLTQADKEDLLTDKLHNMRFERTLSKRIYSIFTSMDPTTSVP